LSNKNTCRLWLAADDDGETVWATALGNNRYQIDNIPFFCYNVSVADVVVAVSEGDLIRVQRIAKKSGHRTVRIAFEEPNNLESPVATALVAYLEQVGCAYEGFPPMLLAIDVPPSVDVDAVIAYCEEAGLTWEYGDPQPERQGYPIEQQG
jgi:hypothetical protein